MISTKILISVAEKLHWAFKLYDKDGNGEIDQEEIEEIFTKLCVLVNVEKENYESAQDKDCLMGAKLRKQQETSNLHLMSQKLQTRKKFKYIKPEEKQK